MFNPNEAIQEILSRLLSIEEILQQRPIHQVNNQQLSELIGLKEAAKQLFLSEDRLYAIHKDKFNTVKPGKKILFFRSEIHAYLQGEIIILKNSPIQEAEDFRIGRLKKKMKAV